MQKANGEILIAIGSILMIVSASIGILLGLLFTVAGAWIWSILGWAIVESGGVPGLTGFIMGLGAVVGIIIIAFSVLMLVFGVMSFKRKGDPRRATFPLVIGIIFTIFAVVALLSDFSAYTALSVVPPVLLLIGGILNKGQAKNLPPEVPYSGYPQGQPPYQPYQDPYQQPYQQTPPQQPYQPPYQQPETPPQDPGQTQP